MSSVTRPARRGRPSRTEIFSRLDAQIEDLRQRLGGLPSPAEARNIWGDIWCQEAHNSTAIEGNTLVLKEVEVLLAEGRAVGNKQLRDYLEVNGYAAAAQWVYRQGMEGDWRTAGLLTTAELRHIHTLAMTPVWEVEPHPDATLREQPGAYREHDIEPFPGGMKPPPWSDVPPLMRDWVESVRQLRDHAGATLELIAEHHARFERIHPFLDGNGRTGRLVTNLVLLRFGYPPALIYKRDRERYLMALRRADRDDAGTLAEMLARAVLDTLQRFVVPAVAGPARMVPLAALTDRTISVRALRAAAERGRLAAQRGPDGQWLSSRRLVDDYKKRRHQRE